MNFCWKAISINLIFSGFLFFNATHPNNEEKTTPNIVWEVAGGSNFDGSVKRPKYFEINQGWFTGLLLGESFEPPVYVYLCGSYLNDLSHVYIVIYMYIRHHFDFHIPRLSPVGESSVAIHRMGSIPSLIHKGVGVSDFYCGADGGGGGWWAGPFFEKKCALILLKLCSGVIWV